MQVSSTPSCPPIWRTIKRYSIITSSIMVVALNALFLYSKLDSSAPLALSRWALLGLSFVGLQALPYWIHFAQKLYGDTKAAVIDCQLGLAFLTGLKGLYILSSIGLLVAGAWATYLGIHGDLQGQTDWYHAMVPVGLVSLGVNVVLLFAYMALNIKAISELEQQDEFKWTPLIRSVVDKDTLEEVLKHESTMTKEIILSNLTTQLKYVQGADLCLQMLGSGLQGVEIWCTPDSIVTASINLGVSVLWLAKLGCEKSQEILQRRALRNADQRTEGLQYREQLPLETREDRLDSPEAARV